jgi:hypothetical protein
MSIEEKRKRRTKRKAKKAERIRKSPIHLGHHSLTDAQELAILNSLNVEERFKILEIVNEAGRQWQWREDCKCMVEVPDPDHDEYTMELLGYDMLFIGRHVKDLDFHGWLFAILAEKGGAEWAETIFARLNKDATGRQWAKWTLDPDAINLP